MKIQLNVTKCGIGKAGEILSINSGMGNALICQGVAHVVDWDDVPKDQLKCVIVDKGDGEDDRLEEDDSGREGLEDRED